MRAARLHAAKNYIREHLDRPDLSVDQVATAIGVRRRYVQSLFESEGTSFSRYVLDERLARAYRLLTHPALRHHSIAQLAFDCGFGDLSYFNRTFRRRYGATPSDIRAATEMT
jgi:AraC-like DNA-binding protein